MPKRVVFSDRAFASLLAETNSQIATETGGLFLGFRTGEIWYVVETIDPGPNSIFHVAYFEYDHAYVNHLMKKIAYFYDKDIELLGLWHRHPGSMDTFSSTDDGTISEYANLHQDGTISALVNIDPSLRLTLYAVPRPMQYDRISYRVGDRLIPEGLLSYKDHHKQIELIEKRSSELRGAQAKDKQGRGFIKSFFYDFVDDLGNKLYAKTEEKKHVQSQGVSFREVLEWYTEKNKAQLEDVYINNKRKFMNQNDYYETILEQLDTDMKFLSSVGVVARLSLNERHFLQLIETDEDMCLIVTFIYDRRGVIYHYKGRYFKYQKGTYRAAYEDYASIRGGRDD